MFLHQHPSRPCYKPDSQVSISILSPCLYGYPAFCRRIQVYQGLYLVIECHILGILSKRDAQHRMNEDGANTSLNLTFSFSQLVHKIDVLEKVSDLTFGNEGGKE